jgi:hypothetical protein
MTAGHHGGDDPSGGGGHSGSARTEAVPERIARLLREAMDGGDYPPGVALPAEKVLAARFGASAPAVRESLAILGAEARVMTVNGKGTFVLGSSVPAHVIAYDPADPWHDLTPVGEPTRTRGAADARTAALLGIDRLEFLHILDQAATHATGAPARVRRILPHSSYDGMDHYPDPMGPRHAITTALTEARGPLTLDARYGATIPDTRDRAALHLTTLGAVTLYAATITRAPDGTGLLLDTVHYNAAETELTRTP